MITQFRKKQNPKKENLKKIKKNPFTKRGDILILITTNNSGVMITQFRKKQNPKKSEKIKKNPFTKGGDILILITKLIIKMES